MTSLIDVIFLLLLFFMLSSTFSRFSEVEIAAAGGGGTVADTSPFFLRLEAEKLSLNGQPQTLETLPAAFAARDTDVVTMSVLISLRDGVNAQRLTDLLVVLRGVQGVQVTVLGAS